MLIAVFTGSRAEWGLLKNLRSVLLDKGHNVTTIFANQHLIMRLDNDDNNSSNNIDIKVHTLLASDRSSAISKSIALNIISLSDIFTNNNFDYLIILGDRFESLGAAVTAYTTNIPIVHIHGGEKTFGSKDDAYRDCITRLSSIHFPASEIFGQRIQEITGSANEIYYCGCLGVDGLSKRRNPVPHTRTFLYLVNPPAPYSDIMLDHLRRYGHVTVISPNPDTDYIAINQSFGQIKAQSFTREQFINKLVSVDAIVGNSSSGIIEAPALGVPTINIGDRQKGRPMAKSIINCGTTISDLDFAIDRLYSDEFKHVMLSNYKLYYSGYNVADKMIKVLEDHAAVS